MECINKNSLCRLCLHSNGILVGIFEENNKHGYAAAEVIEDLLHLQVSQEDSYPRLICEKCLDKLTEFKQFKNQCHISIATYENMYFSEELMMKEEDYDSEDSVIYVDSESSDEKKVTKEQIEKSNTMEGRQEVPSTTAFVDDNLVTAPVLYDVQHARHFLDVGVPSGCVDNKFGIEPDGYDDNDEGNLMVYNEDGPFTCRICGLILLSTGDLFTHWKSHVSMDLNSSRYPCQECGKQYQRKNMLFNHLRKHIGGMLFPCRICGNVFSHEGTLSEHVLLQHGQDRPYHCDQCGKDFKARSGLRKHLVIHSSIKPYCCETCGKCFSRQDKLVVHLRVHTGERPYSCPICSKSFSRRDKLTTHAKLHVRDDNKQYKCSYCEKGFSRQDKLVLHVRIHTGEKPYSCGACGRSFARSDNLNAHMKIHEEKPYWCCDCGEVFTSRVSLKEHAFVHGKGTFFSCEVCGKVFNRRGNLETHSRVHSGERPFACEICSKTFGSKGNLKSHERVHTKERPFSCEDCGKCFSQKSDLVKHVRVHSGERPFSCFYCQKDFAQKSNLRQHLQKVHLAEGTVEEIVVE